MSKTTAIYAVYSQLRGFKDGTQFTRDAMYRRLSNHTHAGINNALYKMVKNGALKGNTDGSYTVIMNDMMIWGKNKVWKDQYISRPGVRGKTTRKPSKPTDAELIENMFAAIEAARPAIAKLQDTAKVLKNLYGDGK